MLEHKFLTTEEVADVLRLTTWRVLQLCREKKIVATKPAGQWLIAEDDLRTYIASGSNQDGDAA